MARPKPLPRENDQVVYGVSSVLLTGTAEFWARDDDAELPRVELGGGRRGGVPAVEEWRQAVRRGLRALGLAVKTGVFQDGTMGAVYLAEADHQAARLAAEQAMVEHGPAGAARQELERRLPLFEQYRASLPPFVQRRHAEQLDAARERAERGIEALQRLYRH